MKLLDTFFNLRAILLIGSIAMQAFSYQITFAQCDNEVTEVISNNSQCLAYSCDLLCFESTTGNDDVSAQMAIEVNENGDEITIRTTYAKTFCDNTYGDNTIGWPGDNHTFNHLKGSDKLELELYNGDGEIALKFKLDYIHDNDLGPSGYATGGVSDPDGDGKMLIGDEDDIINVRTSLSENFNTYGYVLTTNSPATDENYTPNPDYPDWIFEVWYEVTVSASAFGASGYDHPVISDFHASPSKTGNNTEPLEFVGCCSENCDGAIDLTLSSENAPYTFLWSNGETTEDIDGLCAGEYEVMITDATGCQTSYSYQIEDPVPQIEVDASIVNNTLCADTICELLCFESPTGNDDVSAQMSIEVNENGDEITIRTTYAKTFCDNTYGDNTIGWPGDNHTFNHLKGSDKLELELYNGDGEIALKFKLDYIHANDLGPSGYATGGVSDPDGDGEMLIGDEDDIISVRTSLSENFNTYGYVLTTNSPATDENYTPNPDYPDWIFEVWYEVTVSASAFGASGYDHPAISDFHASPSKTGNNSEPLEFVGCCEDNCNGSIDLTVTLGDGPFSYLWSNGATTEDIDGLCDGEYSVNVYDASGCHKEFQFQVSSLSDCEIICPDDVTIECSGSTDPSVTGSPTLSENCSDALLSYTDSISNTNGNCMTIMRTWSITDNCENNLSCVQYIFIVDLEAPVIIEGPEDEYYQCLNDVPDSTYTILAMDNCGTDLNILMTETMEGDDCEQIITRTWLAIDDCGNESLPFIQQVFISDTIAPVLMDLPADLDLECGEDIPAPNEVWAEDNCSTDVDVSFEEMTNAGENTSCILETPFGNYTSFALWLPNFAEGGLTAFWVFDANNGLLTMTSDSTASISGHLVNTGDTNKGFDFNILLEDKKDWETWHNGPNNGNYKDDFAYGADYYQSWDYYIISNASTLIGTGDLEGSVLNLSHAPANHYYAFQLGTAANNLNANYGGSGWFDYTGNYQGVEVSGSGDLGFDADCSPCGYSILRTWTATDDCGNSTSYTQTINIDGQQQIFVDEDYYGQGEVQNFASLITYPNPFIEKNFVEFVLNEEGDVNLGFFNVDGKLIKELYNGKVKADQPYKFTLDVENLPSGIYIYKLSTPKEIIIKRVLLAK